MTFMLIKLKPNQQNIIGTFRDIRVRSDLGPLQVIRDRVRPATWTSG